MTDEVDKKERTLADGPVELEVAFNQIVVAERLVESAHQIVESAHLLVKGAKLSLRQAATRGDVYGDAIVRLQKSVRKLNTRLDVEDES